MENTNSLIGYKIINRDKKSAEEVFVRLIEGLNRMELTEPES